MGNFCRPNVERPFDFVASVYAAKATQSTLSTCNKVNRVEFNFVASVYRAEVERAGNSGLLTNRQQMEDKVESISDKSGLKGKKGVSKKTEDTEALER